MGAYAELSPFSFLLAKIWDTQNCIKSQCEEGESLLLSWGSFLDDPLEPDLPLHSGPSKREMHVCLFDPL